MADWRLQGQEKYLYGVELRKKRYHKYSGKWEHDHCEFCWRKFSEDAKDLNTGFATLHDYHWICEDCFEDFKDRFNWIVINPGTE